MDSKFVSTIIFLCLLSPIVDHKLGYIFLGILSLYGLFNFKYIINRSNLIVFSIPLFIFLSWLYGILIALVMANNIKYIFMNFLGLAFYPAFYGLLAAKIPIYKLLRVVLYAATIYFIYGGYLLLESVLFDKYLINAALSVSDYRVLYLAQTLYLVPFISIGLLKISGVISLNEFYWRGLSLPEWSITNLFIISSLLIVVFLSMSKAFIGIIIILLVLTFLLALMKFLYGANLRPFVFIVLTISFVAFLINSDVFELLIFSFTSNESSNMVRDEQFGLIVNEFTFHGSGLGAILSSGYVRSIEAPYGFELTFLSLFHKIGFMILPLLISYILPLIYGLFFIIKRNHSSVIGAFLIGAMSFIIPGYANPMLLASNFVMIHILCLYIIYNKNNIS